MSALLATATTRGELLAARAERLPALERRAWSVPAAAEVSLWAVALTLASGLPDLGGSAVDYSVVAVVGAVALWRLASRLRAWLAARGEIEAWRRADRSARARALPAGEIAPGLRTPYDARDDADLDEVVAEAGATATGRIYDMRMLWFGMALVPSLVMAILLVLMALPVSGQGPGSRVVAAGAALLVWTVMGWFYAGWQRELWRRQQALNSSGLEKDLWRARRSLLQGEEPPGPGPVAPTPPGSSWCWCSSRSQASWRSGWPGGRPDPPCWSRSAPSCCSPCRPSSGSYVAARSTWSRCCTTATRCCRRPGTRSPSPATTPD